MRRQIRGATALLALCVGFAVRAFAADAPIDAALKDPSRPPYDLVRDAARKPAAMLAFAGVKQGQVIADFMPGGGYYTRLLSKIAGTKGRVFAIVPRFGWAPPSPAPLTEAQKQQRDTAERMRQNGISRVLAVADTAGYGNIDVTSFAVDQFGGQFSLPLQADLVWTSDNYHDLHTAMAAKADGSPLDVVGLNKAIFAALKPGGVFVVVDHASAKGAGFAVAQTLHRADEDAAKAEILSAGFTLDGESNVLADAADDHTRKVFELHDTTDQFALRFKKPANAPRDRRITNAEMKGYFGNSMISLTPRHVFFHEDGTYQELGLPGEQAVQGGRWIADAMHHLCMQHDFDLRGTTTCYDIPVNKKVGDTWTSDTYGIGRMITFRLEKGYVYPPGVLDKKQ